KKPAIAFIMTGGVTCADSACGSLDDNLGRCRRAVERHHQELQDIPPENSLTAFMNCHNSHCVEHVRTNVQCRQVHAG
ncbi:MAG: hypothetical protein WAV53_21945, partial [Anaerolineae bacterium]